MLTEFIFPLVLNERSESVVVNNKLAILLVL